VALFYGSQCISSNLHNNCTDQHRLLALLDACTEDRDSAEFSISRSTINTHHNKDCRIEQNARLSCWSGIDD